jgi:ubiquinone/menaquinone biosynthesis C-methylase UbiE
MYSNPEAYEAYMGRWSAALAPAFLDFALADASPVAVLDLGCGPGSLLRAAARRLAGARLVGLDPTADYLEHARTALGVRPVALVTAIAERLPFAGNVFDACLSLLVLQEFADRAAALGELHRVTRRGGIVAGAQWAFADGMPVTTAMRSALAEVAVHCCAALDAGPSRPFQDEEELRRHWESAGLVEVETTRLTAVQKYGGFDELWTPLLSGPTPASAAIASLPSAQLETVRIRLAASLGLGGPDRPFSLTARALAVRGRKP